MDGRVNGARAPTVAAVGGLLAMAAALGIGRFAYTPILPFMEAAGLLSKAEAGVLASANYLGYLAGAFGATTSALPGTRRRWFTIGLMGSVLTTVAMAAVGNLPAFLALRFLGGVASAFVLVFGSAMVLDALGMANRLSLTWVHFAGVGTGISLSALLVGGFGVSSNWRTLWLVAGLAAGVMLLGAARTVPDADHRPRRDERDPSRSSNRLRKLILSYGLFGFGYVITATFISTLVRDSEALRHLEVAVWLTVGLAALPSVALWVRVGLRIGNDRAFAVACLVEGVGVALSVIAEHPVAVLMAAALLGGTFVGITALGLVAARELSTGDPRRSIAWMTASFGLGQMVGPTFAGFAFGLGDSFLFPSLVAAGALLAAARLSRDVLAGSEPGAGRPA